MTGKLQNHELIWSAMRWFIKVAVLSAELRDAAMWGHHMMQSSLKMEHE